MVSCCVSGCGEVEGDIYIYVYVGGDIYICGKIDGEDDVEQFVMVSEQIGWGCFHKNIICGFVYTYLLLLWSWIDL